jgi:hypothetical protein
MPQGRTGLIIELPCCCFLQLEELEAAMREDVANELSKWGGRILLHREVQRAPTPPEMSPACLSPLLTAGKKGSLQNGHPEASLTSPFVRGLQGNGVKAPNGVKSDLDAAVQKLAAAVDGDNDALERAPKRHKEDITTVVDFHPGNTVVAFWEPTTGRVDASNGMCTARQVCHVCIDFGCEKEQQYNLKA